MYWLGLILSAGVGLSLGLIGGGGSILTVPILVYFLGVEPRNAVMLSLVVVGATSLFGASLHFRRGNVELMSGVTFGVAGFPGAMLGSPLTRMVSPGVLLLGFGVLMLVTAIVMLTRKNEKPDESTTRPQILKSVAAGFGVGVLTGFLGVGGGFLIVPALVMFGGLPMKKAVGTSLFVIFLNCAAGLLGHFGDGVVDWKLTWIVTFLALGGALLGSVISRHVAALRLQTAFGVLVLIVSVFLLSQNYRSLF